MWHCCLTLAGVFPMMALFTPSSSVTMSYHLDPNKMGTIQDTTQGLFAGAPIPLDPTTTMETMTTDWKLSTELHLLPNPIIISCKGDAAEKPLALPFNQRLHVSPDALQTHRMQGTNIDYSDATYFALPFQPINKSNGYFSAKHCLK